MKLVIAEKPSVANALAQVIGADKRREGYLEGNGFLISWCLGHLVESAPPSVYDEEYRKWRISDLPIVPQEWKYVVLEDSRKQFEVLKVLMARPDVGSLICATDAGREGELIFRLVYRMCGCQKPFERLWISSMEEDAIREGFRNLRPSSEYDALYEAALCREHADWIVGINATRLFSCRYGETLNVGRVMTPTLAMVTERDEAVRAFVPETFYTVELDFGGFTAVSPRIKSRGEAEELLEKCRSGEIKVGKTERKMKTENPPRLYDLTSLQRDANRIFGYSAQQTLDYAQGLYEKKLITYPRTDSRYLTDDMEKVVTPLIGIVEEKYKAPAFSRDGVAKLLDSKKVTDHHALIPTRAFSGAELMALPKGEQSVLRLVAGRLVMAAGDPHLFEETRMEITAGGETFKASGKVVKEEGWKAAIKFYLPEMAGKEKEGAVLPDLGEGDVLSLSDASVKEGKTTPPKAFTEDTLLSAMETAGAKDVPEDVERKGLGTPATRAGIIEKLVRKGFIERKGDKKTKYLASTEKGKALIRVLPEEICSPLLTAEWEEKLKLIEKGQYRPGEFMEEIKMMAVYLVAAYDEEEDSLLPEIPSDFTCPACGNPIIHGAKGWFCRDKACRFAIWEDNAFLKAVGKEMTPYIAEHLLAGRKVLLKGCISRKTGKKYNAYLSLGVSEEGRAVYRLSFADNKGRKKS